MTQGCRRSCESCLTSMPCGIRDGYGPQVGWGAGFCCEGVAGGYSCPTDNIPTPPSDCPSTLNVSFMLPEFQHVVCCGDPINAYVHWTIPAIERSITIARHDCCADYWGGQCGYSGGVQSDIRVKSNDVCTYGRANIVSQSTSFRFYSNGYYTYPYFLGGRSPCANAGDTSPEDAGKCCGIMATITDEAQYSSGQRLYYRMFHYAFRNNFIDDCETPCPCYEEYVSGQGHYSMRWSDISAPSGNPCYAQQEPEFFDIEVS